VTRRLLGASIVLAAVSRFAGPAAAAPAHYVVLERDEAGRVEAVFAREVELAGAPRSMNEDELVRALASAPRADEAVALRVASPDGTIVHRDVVDIPRFVRGEFHGEGEGQPIEGHVFPVERVAFVVRVPRVPGAVVTLDGAARGTFEPARLVEEQARRSASEGAPPTVMATRGSGGPSSNRVDVLIVGDGYTAPSASLFASHAQALEDGFFAIAPYAPYRAFHVVHTLFVASAQSGADHPPYVPGCQSTSCCGDDDALSDPLAGTFVDTAFDARFCAQNLQRLLVVNASKVFAAASAVPDWDRILVIVNDTTYGGSGGFLSVASRNGASIEIARHEYGHSFTGLADEYESPFSYPPCSDGGGASPCEANVTDVTALPMIKWEPWIAPTTPVPTPEQATWNGVVGLFEGARYDPSGMYRPRNLACLMRSLSQPYCEVCRQETVLTLYRGGWGVPEDGVDPIEPGGESPPPGPVTVTGPETFSIDLVAPVGHGNTLDVTWLVDGVPQPASDPPSTFTLVPRAATHVVRVEVSDPTAYVHPELRGDVLESAREWVVTVEAAGPPGSISTLSVERAPGSAGDLVLLWDASCSPAGTGYGIYEGALGDWYGHAAIDCTDDDGSPLSETVTPREGSAYYLVVPHHTTAEGSYGASSAGAPRPSGATVCVAARHTGCP
jgi:hypothetical protein